MNQTQATLIAAKAVIDTPEKWIRGASACDRKGIPVAPRSHYATCFCIIGAVDRVAKNFDDRREAFDMLYKSTNIDIISEWNDDPARTHAEVMEAFDKAIQLAATAY